MPVQLESRGFPSALLIRRILLGFALLSALVVYWPVLNAGWFYDDADYVIGDPRMDHLELFMPGHWSSPPPPLESASGPALFLPGYEKPLITDRYLWHLSFGIERKIYGSPYGRWAACGAHVTNLLIHLTCIVLLYFALTRLVELYLEEYIPVRTEEGTDDRRETWRMLPCIAALIFAIHPWASEPVCYVSARNGSMGTLFVLAGLIAWIGLFTKSIPIWRRALSAILVLCCAVAAYGCKENFVTAIPGLILLVWPLLWIRLWRKSPAATIGAVAAVLALAFIVGWAGIKNSDRASGLFAQTMAGNGIPYAFEIQNPLVLSTLADQIPVQRLSLESNFPGWPAWLCWIGLTLNAAIVLVGVFGGMRWPVLLGLAWFYLHLVPTNSILPRPDFLAVRNVYMPVAGISVLCAALFLCLFNYFNKSKSSGLRWAVLSLGAGLWFFWAASTHVWACGFASPDYKVWKYSALVAPDHAAVRLNHAAVIVSKSNLSEQEKVEAKKELFAALAAEDSPTMRYHTERPRAMRKALAERILGQLMAQDGQFGEAVKHLSASFSYSPATPAWAMWAEASISGNLESELDKAADAGARQWPQAWWPVAARALQHIMAAGKGALSLGPKTLMDLQAAERAENTTQPELRSLQVRVLMMIAQTGEGRTRLPELMSRLRELGVPPEELEKLQK